MGGVTDLLAQLERYYDTVPRRFARAEECGPFTLFLGEPGGWVYYARPRHGGSGPFDAAAVAAALSRLREHGLPEVVEWVHETTPTLLDAVRAEGSLEIEEIPLMVLDGDVEPVPLPAGVTVRLVPADDESAVAASSAVATVAFAAPGTARGDEGPVERDARRRPGQQRVLDLLAEGVVRIAVAETERDGVVATGRTLPLDGVAEVVGVATLPSARRQGLGAAVTAALVADARASGVGTVFLTASSAEVSRVYSRIGFRRVGTGYAAERHAS
jgi:N-acetylglutamate synthase-like GNAT family acetyltransferase